MNLAKKPTSKQTKIIATAIIAGVASAFLIFGGGDFLLRVFSGRANDGTTSITNPSSNLNIPDISKRPISDFFTTVCGSRLMIWGDNIVRDADVRARSGHLCRESYALLYDSKLMLPLWSEELISGSNIEVFNIPKSFIPHYDIFVNDKDQLPPDAFRGTKYKAGLLASPKNSFMKMPDATDEVVEETNRKRLIERFYMTNVFPVTAETDAVLDKINDLAQKQSLANQLVIKVSGLVYLNGKYQDVIKVKPQQPKTDSGKSDAPSQTVTADILVPTHIYVILVSPGLYGSYSFIVPNTKLDCGLNCDINRFSTTFSEVERVSGTIFHSGMAPVAAYQIKRNPKELLEKTKIK